MKIIVDWDLDGLSLEEADVPKVVEVPPDVWAGDSDSISDWLSDTYGWCHFGWIEWKP
jgi:hypothetical protein